MSQENITPSILHLVEKTPGAVYRIPVCIFSINRPNGTQEKTLALGIGYAALSSNPKFSGILETYDSSTTFGFSGTAVIILRTLEVVGINIQGSRWDNKNIGYAILASNMRKWIEEIYRRENIKISSSPSGKVSRGISSSPSEPSLTRPMTREDIIKRYELQKLSALLREEDIDSIVNITMAVYNLPRLFRECESDIKRFASELKGNHSKRDVKRFMSYTVHLLGGKKV